jgi:hypothetical protein
VNILRRLMARRTGRKPESPIETEPSPTGVAFGVRGAR